LLEDWTGRTLTFNGCFALMFHSRFATGPWMGSGASIGIYNPPNRNWAFDSNFLDLTRAPTGTPIMLVVPPGN
jgi:hypothetical protein